VAGGSLALVASGALEALDAGALCCMRPRAGADHASMDGEYTCTSGKNTLSMCSCSKRVRVL